jgi:hypothetical protein
MLILHRGDAICIDNQAVKKNSLVKLLIISELQYLKNVCLIWTGQTYGNYFNLPKMYTTFFKNNLLNPINTGCIRIYIFCT